LNSTGSTTAGSSGADHLFGQYLAARDRADQTRRLEDGIAAGHACRRILDTFTEAA
jgi:hypothetical protein